MDRGHIILPQFGWGFYSNYFRTLSHLMEADRLDIDPWVDWRNTAFVEGYNPYKLETLPAAPENPWDWWFDQRELADDTLVTVYIDYNTFDHQSRVWQRPDIPVFRKINDKYIKIKKHITDKVDAIYEAEFKGKIVLGVMARGCEMNKGHAEFGNQTIDTWLEKITAVTSKHKIDKIFIVTEDSHYLPYFDKQFSNTFYLKDVFRRTDETLDYMEGCLIWFALDDRRENHCQLLGEECLIQALLLSKCDYLIIKQCGTSSAAILFSDDIKEVFYTMPEDVV